MKKLFVFLFCLLWAASAAATVSTVEIIDESLYKDVLKNAKITEYDVSRYGRIFKAIKDNNYEKADKLILKLNSDALMGHVLAQKYLTTDYNTSYEELQKWLKKYTYLPQYEAIKALSVRKNPKYKKTKHKKQQTKIKPKIYASYEWYRDDYTKLKSTDRKYVKEKIYDFLVAIRKTDNKTASEIMNDYKFRMTIPDKNYDGMSATLAASYFYEEKYEQALQWTRKAIRRSKEPTAAWFGGMSAWKMKNYKTAASLFGQLAGFENDDKWLLASGAYWAYRANLKLGKTKTAMAYLRKAATHERTFYGILAKAQLGRPIDYDWRIVPHFNSLKTDEYKNELLKSPIIRRAILLIKAGETDLAEADLRKHYKKLTAMQKELVMFISSQYSLANLSYLIANGLKDYKKRRNYDGFLYPYPDWEPIDGWKINQSWIWALTRQESLFNHTVKSHAGACGLMQIMPNTAANVTKDKEYKKGCSLLFDKMNNLTIGQNYVDILLNDENVGNNLFLLAASYNGGPHNVKKWLDKNNYENDPLLFVEMIPWRETRLYVKKVVANYWIYNSRRGLKSKSLEQLKHNQWPEMD